MISQKKSQCSYLKTVGVGAKFCALAFDVCEFLCTRMWKICNNFADYHMSGCKMCTMSMPKIPTSFQSLSLTTIGGLWYFDRAFVTQKFKNQSLYNKILLLQKFNYTLKVLKPKKSASNIRKK